MRSRAEEVAKAVLYEGYILYPYRPSSVKNQQRWNFGVVYPPGSSEGAATMQTECLAMASSGGASLEVKVCFLHLLARTIAQLEEPVPELPEGVEPASHAVQKIECDGEIFQSWQEGVERELELPHFNLQDLIAQPVRHAFQFRGSRTTQPVRDLQGPIAWLIIREQLPVTGSVEISAEDLGSNLLRITISLHNSSLADIEERNIRDGVLLRSFVSAHKILTVREGEFISLIDPPTFCQDAAEECKNIGTWPVLAGEGEQRDVMLSSPIILYDYPQIAPESAGDLCDGTEIDEILSLRILTLTDEEKREMRQSDERGRRILERTETLPEEQWRKLHGILRGLRPATEVIQ